MWKSTVASYEDDQTHAREAATAMPVILENGRKVFGPPSDYTGPRPSYHCELYVSHIPQQLDEDAFLVWLHRIGRVFEFRLMMDTGNSTRGYAFIRFCLEKDALAAFELLKYLFVDEGEDRLSVYRSQGKNRLFISGIPRQIPLNLLEENFKLCFPQMQSCTAYPALLQNKLSVGREKEENRGFAFIEFYDHEMALEAKKRLTPGRVRMWGVDLKVQWAKPKEELQNGTALKKYNNMVRNKRNPASSYLPNDYCAKLRLYCLANNLCIPVVVYGQSYPSFHLQYAGILVKNNFNGEYSMFIYELMVARMSDIHLVMCELAVKIIERAAGHLYQHTLFRVVNDTKAEIVCTVKRPEELLSLNLTRIFKIPTAIKNMAKSLQLLAELNSEKLLVLYKRSFLTQESVASFDVDTESPYGKFYSILPKFRNNTKLNNNFNDMEINLLQNPTVDLLVPTENMLNFTMWKRNYHAIEAKNFENVTLKSQHGYGIKYLLRYVDIHGLEQRLCYHTTQRVNSNPIWIAGQSFQKSIYN